MVREKAPLALLHQEWLMKHQGVGAVSAHKDRNGVVKRELVIDKQRPIRRPSGEDQTVHHFEYADTDTTRLRDFHDS